MSQFSRLSIWFAILALLWVGGPIVFVVLLWLPSGHLSEVFTDYGVRTVTQAFVTVMAVVLLAVTLWRSRKRQ